jgi:hypothetical protein
MDDDDDTEIAITSDSSRRDHRTVRDIEDENGTRGWNEHLVGEFTSFERDDDDTTLAAIVDTSREDAWIRSDYYYLVDGRGDFEEHTNTDTDS